MAGRCRWCGGELPAATARRRYCSDACRQAAYRARKGGVRLRPEVDSSAPAHVRARLDDRDVAAAVVQARGAAATLDAAGRRGPRELRALCARLAGGILSLLEEVGL